MKPSTWIGGLALFLGVSSATFLLVLPADGFLRERERSAGESLDREKTLQELQLDVRTGFGAVEVALENELEAAARALRGIDSSKLAEALRSGESNPKTKGALREKISRLLAEALDDRALDFLVLVTHQGEMISGGTRFLGNGGSGMSPDELSRLRTACQPFLDDVREFTSVEALPGKLVAKEDGKSPDPNFFLTAARPLRTPSEKTHPILVGGVALQTVAERFHTVTRDSGADLRFHFFSSAGTDVPVVIAGDGVGSVVRMGLVRELAAGGVSEKPALAKVGQQIGRWRGLRSSDGKWIGGWGVTVELPAFNATPLPPLDPPQVPGIFTTLGLLETLAAAGVIAAGMCTLWFFLALWSRLASEKQHSHKPGKGRSHPAAEGNSQATGHALTELASEFQEIRIRLVRLEAAVKSLRDQERERTRLPPTAERDENPETELVR